MDKEKEFGFDTVPAKEEFNSDSASRARNKTVMLTPEMTSQVRNRFQQEGAEPQPQSVGNPSSRSQGGYETPRSSGVSYESSATSSGFIPAPALQKSYPETPTVHPRAVSAPSPQPAPSGDRVQWVRETPVVGFLVSYDTSPNGVVFELRVGRLIVSNQSSPDNLLYLSDPSVSLSHAIIRVGQSGEIQVLDQLSEFGTSIKRFGSEQMDRLSGDKATVEHGDILSFGNRHFHLCIVPRES